MSSDSPPSEIFSLSVIIIILLLKATITYNLHQLNVYSGNKLFWNVTYENVDFSPLSEVIVQSAKVHWIFV